jgi:hypothetical protein
VRKLTGPFGRWVARWWNDETAYRVRRVCYADGTHGLVIEVLGPGREQRSAVIRGDVESVAPLRGWDWSTDAQRTAAVEALFDPRRWC